MQKRSSSLSQEREIGRRIRIRRLELGMSQTVLADALDLSFQQVQKYEKGKNRVSSGRLQDIARILGVPVTFFFSDFTASGAGTEILALLETSYSLRMLKALGRINNRRIQKSTLELVEAIADSLDRTAT